MDGALTVDISFSHRGFVNVDVSRTKEELGSKAAREGAELIRKAIEERGEAFVIVATGASQFEMLDHLVREEVDWNRVTAFHLDEYVGMPITHPASFRRYLKERFVDRLPHPIRSFNYIDGEGDPQAECDRLGRVIGGVSIDVAFVGIGENAHLAFNDPPADFETEVPYLVVRLDDDCRRQQLGEGWFGSFDEVPERAISMSIRQIMKSRHIIAVVPDERKAKAVQGSVEGPVTPDVPSSILQGHPDCRLFLDTASASRLRPTSPRGAPEA